MSVNKIIWINFLHLYQPANADDFTIQEATEKSYERIVRALEEHPNARFTLNISGCLVERWHEMGRDDLIDRIKKLIGSGKIELVGTAMYHAMLPLVPIKEAKRQIREHEETVRKYFGPIRMNGFFLPEMAYSTSVGKLIKSSGYKWVILDEIAHQGVLDAIDNQKIYRTDYGLQVLYRSRAQSTKYAPDIIAPLLANGSAEGMVISATDGELFGLRHIDQSAEFEKVLDDQRLVTKTISEYIDGASDGGKTEPLPSSWDSREEELKLANPYALWLDPENKIQTELWKLARLAWKTSDKYEKDQNAKWSRWHLVRGLASCTFWWASQRDFKDIFGPLAWNPDMVELGVNELLRSIRAIDNPDSRSVKLKAEKLGSKIKLMVWEKHWTSQIIHNT